MMALSLSAVGRSVLLRVRFAPELLYGLTLSQFSRAPKMTFPCSPNSQAHEPRHILLVALSNQKDAELQLRFPASPA